MLVGGLLIAGGLQAVILADSQASFNELIETLKPWLLCSSFGIGLILLGSTYILVNLGVMLKPESECSCCESTEKHHA
jgi:hypothetical protein